MTHSLRAALVALLALCLAVAATQGRAYDADAETTSAEDSTKTLNSTKTNDDATKAQTPSSVTLLNYPGDTVDKDIDDGAETEATPAEDAASSAEENNDKTIPQPTLGTKTTPVESEEDDDVIWPRTDERRRNAAGDIVIEDTDDAVVEDRLEGLMPSIAPDEDPSTVFAPWTIAVIAGVGAIIVAVVAYYVWQRWTEIRSCCCGGEYSRP